jgi:hypothetical protein
MAKDEPSELTRGLRLAFRLCGEAVDVLDACGAPTAIAPNLELALQEIKRALGNPPNPNTDATNMDQ